MPHLLHSRGKGRLIVPDGSTHRRTIYYRGRVQGVGFRWQATRCIQGLPVTGYVRNLADGRVELVLEGAAEQTQAVADRVQTEMGGYIDSASEQLTTSTGEFRDFRVVR